MAVRVPMWSKIADPGLVEAAPSAFGFKNAGTIFSNMGLSIIIHLKGSSREFSIMFESLFLVLDYIRILYIMRG